MSPRTGAPDSEVPKIRITRLENGAVVATETLPELRSASLGVYLDVGSRDEPSAVNGLAHLFEHMVFKGTDLHTPLEIVKCFETTGGQVNAFTSKEQTCFYAKVVDSEVSSGLGMLLEMVLRASFDPSELDKEKDVIIEEIKGVNDNPEDYVYELFSEACFGRHGLGRPIAGTVETVSGIRRAHLLRHRERAAAELPLFVIAVGRVSHEDVVSITKKSFGLAAAGRQRPPGPARWNLPRSRAPWKPKHLLEKRGVQQANVLLGGPGYDWNHRNRHALLLLNCVLGDGMSSRLFQNLREERGLVYTVYSTPEFLINAGSFAIGFATETKDVRNAVREINRELVRLKRDGISADDLDFAKKNLRGGILLGMESTNTRMANLSRQLMYGQPGETIEKILRKLDSVSLSDVRTCIRDVFTAKRWASAAIVPKKANVSVGSLLDF